MTLARRIPLRCTTGLARKTPLARVAGLTRRARLQHRYQDPITAETTYLVWQRSDGRCEQGYVCGGAPLDPGNWDRMHRVRRESGFHDPSNLLAGCRADHEWQRQAGNRMAAERYGWVLSFATLNPALWPVYIGRTWWLLDADGGKTEVAA